MPLFDLPDIEEGGIVNRNVCYEWLAGGIRVEWTDTCCCRTKYAYNDIILWFNEVIRIRTLVKGSCHRCTTV